MRGDHNDLVIELPKFVPVSFCKHIIEKFERESPKRSGTVVYGGKADVIPELKNSIESGCLCCMPGWEHEFKEVNKFMRHAYELYKHQLYTEYYYDQPKHTFQTVLDNEFKEIRPVIQKQPKGGRYAWHFDHYVNMPSPIQHFATIMIYLNTLEPHEGGCTEFGNGRKISPECGKIIIWPATWAYPHNGNEVMDDAKYTIVTPIFTCAPGCKSS